MASARVGNDRAMLFITVFYHAENGVDVDLLNAIRDKYLVYKASEHLALLASTKDKVK